MHSTHCWWLYLTIHFQPQFSRIHDLALGTHVIKNLFFDFCLPNNELQFASTYYFLNLVFYRNDYCNSTVFTDVHTMVNLQEKNDFLTQCTVKKVICLWNKLQRERETARNYPIKFFEMNVVNRRRLFKVFAKDQWKVRERGLLSQRVIILTEITSIPL